MNRTADNTPDTTPAAPPAERADLTAWRDRHELRRSNAAQPITNKRIYRRTTKHRKRDDDR
ncbi:hypothetical protein [Nocardia macrotermitis]|uniref:Uncharacterized protein n=1 Tax=Nocardia macrotermitis TaxID=2585198 RepID=A0A7K0D667_9NOCA|nr:hypothetical protein [Nocardia macrotermitis]MQY21219.1 hypothetical protein [Nocardia macrotermitis]